MNELTYLGGTDQRQKNRDEDESFLKIPHDIKLEREAVLWLD